ncbi:amyloid beta A4 precursor protein-binding family B member 1-interacting protein-like [Brachyistius frenatus]|uniref:amyloid beta A4 precursor protein-binding family B member 1-interacting protein-like n=1 Tax=Brachyistius frenatus TaxID=100188 RepID=UPI0037E8E46D
MDDIDAMFSHLLSEIDNISESLMSAADPAEVDCASHTENRFSFGFTDLNESLNELEDQDLDALVADLGSKLNLQELFTHEQNSSLTDNRTAPATMTRQSEPAAALPSLPNTTKSSRSEPQTKADKIKLALEKLREAKVRKLIVKVLMSDSSSKTLMVDERQTVRELLDQLFEKTHCDQGLGWSMCETNPDLQTERIFEDHEYLVEPLSTWTRHSENKIYFVSRPQKYVMFTDPQLFYMWKKKKACLSGINEDTKQLLIKEHFEGSTVIVPDLEGTLYLKEDGKKGWKPRYFVLRASGIYFVPKGKTKSSSDLVCFVRFEKVNIYTTDNYKQKYRAPTNFCFMLKHPCIQKESDYIKYLCCDDEHTLLVWVNSIRIAKYGSVLYKNYQAAVKRTSTLQTLHCAAHKDRSNGPQTGPSAPKTTNVEDPQEPPPNFKPPPPPEHVQV